MGMDALLAEREEPEILVAAHCGRSHVAGDDVRMNLVMRGNNDRPGHIRLGVYPVAALLPDEREAGAKKDAFEQFPVDGRYAWHRFEFSEWKGMRIGMKSVSASGSELSAGAGEKPQSRRTCSRVPRSKQDSIKRCRASIRFSRASALFFPWVERSSAGQDAMHHPSFS